MNIVHPEEAFSLSNGNTCFTFSDFHANWSTIIDGLCSYRIYGEITPITPSDKDIDPSLVLKYNFRGSVDYSENFEEFCVNCLNARSAPEAPTPQPCGCQLFNFKLILEPCNGIDFEKCEPLEVNFAINICCDCDIRNKVVHD